MVFDWKAFDEHVHSLIKLHYSVKSAFYHDENANGNTRDI